MLFFSLKRQVCLAINSCCKNTIFFQNNNPFWVQKFSHSRFAASASLTGNVPAAWRSWGGNCTQFGLTPTVKGRTEIRTITSPPISPNRLLHAGLFSFYLLIICLILLIFHLRFQISINFFLTNSHASKLSYFIFGFNTVKISFVNSESANFPSIFRMNCLAVGGFSSACL